MNSLSFCTKGTQINFSEAIFQHYYNDLRKSVSHICAIPQKNQSQLRLIVVVNKAQFNPVNSRCGTYHTPTHIIQSIKLGHHNLPHLNP